MFDNSKLRGTDLISSFLFFVLGVWILAESFQMPLQDTYAGVSNVWYVSPAIMPIIIGLAIIILSLVIFIHAIKHGGKESLKQLWKVTKSSKVLSENNIRFAAVVFPLVAMVYMNLTRIDFFLTLVLYLSFSISVFYLDDPRFMRSTLFFYVAEMGILFIISVFGLDKIFASIFVYLLDIIALLLIVALTVFMVKQMKKIEDKADVKRKFRQAMLMTYITPLLVVPIFRYLLRVPLPKEGGIVNLMSLVYYALR
jgi:hypothetical protein